jgi:hypothetical protein
MDAEMKRDKEPGKKRKYQGFRDILITTVLGLGSKRIRANLMAQT